MQVGLSSLPWVRTAAPMPFLYSECWLNPQEQTIQAPCPLSYTCRVYHVPKFAWKGQRVWKKWLRRHLANVQWLQFFFFFWSNFLPQKIGESWLFKTIIDIVSSPHFFSWEPKRQKQRQWKPRSPAQGGMCIPKTHWVPLLTRFVGRGHACT